MFQTRSLKNSVKMSTISFVSDLCLRMKEGAAEKKEEEKDQEEEEEVEEGGVEKGVVEEEE